MHDTNPKTFGQHNSDVRNDNAYRNAASRIAIEAYQIRQSTPPPPPPKRGMRDVTENFVAASRQLPAGELIKCEYFTLFEAVGALEVRWGIVLAPFESRGSCLMGA